MIDTAKFYEYLAQNDLDTFFGVPDSLLKDICAYITSNTTSDKHILTANEGNAVALAAGHYLATGKPAVVYLQNSGLGNIVNPLISLADEEVYNIPLLFIVGWRGEPGVKDEPQHIKQGEITLTLLDNLGVKTIILTDNYQSAIDEAVTYMDETLKPVALVVRKDTFAKFALPKVLAKYTITREAALEALLTLIDKESVIVSTTGKTSREVFELRVKQGDSHERDFLTVGSMGHASSIALGISLATEKKVYCLDGDGAMLMHFGGLGIVAHNAKENFKYIVINNGAHESVGGQPTIAFDLDTKAILKGLGFSKVFEATTISEINEAFPKLDKTKKSALVLYVKQGSRDNLGRPTTTPQENKEAFMKFLKKRK